MLRRTGERQVGVTLEEIRLDHRRRYEFAAALTSPNETVIDAGCGVGYGSNVLAEVAGQVLACDMSQEAIDLARDHWGRSNVGFEVGDLHFLEPKAGILPVDMVVAFEVVEHLLEPRLFLHAARRWLRPEGRLVISVPNELRIEHSVELNPFHIRHYTPEEFARLLGSCGFRVEQRHCQDDDGLAPGDDGKFLIYVARPSQAAGPETEDVARLCTRAMAVASRLIVERAIALSGAKKELVRVQAALERARSVRRGEGAHRGEAGPGQSEESEEGVDRGPNMANVVPAESEHVMEAVRLLIAREQEIERLLEANKVVERDLRSQRQRVAELSAAQRAAAEDKRALAETRQKLTHREQETRDLRSRLLHSAEENKVIKEQLAALHATRAAESTKRDQALGAVTRRAEVLAQDAERLQRLNRDLAGKLDKTTAELTRRRQAQVKPPPSLRTVWAKLRHHRFYVPFWTKVVLNTLGLRGRKASRRA